MKKVKKLVVIASEDLLIINQMSSILRENDYSTLIEKSATKAILKIMEQEINLLILDLDSSGNFNTDLIKIIKKIRPRLLIVVLTKDNSLETIRKFIQAGVFYCVLKPIQIVEINRLLEAVSRHYQKERKVGNTI